MASNPADRDVYLRINRPGNQCLLCQGSLNVDGHHPSLIELSEREEVIRKDFCPKCWEHLSEKSYFSYWVTKRVSAETAAERRLAKSERNEALWRLFAALYGSESAETGPHLFLLAHLLMKYRVLVFKGTGPDGQLLFSHPKLGENFEVPDLPLDSADFVALKATLEQQAVAYAGGAASSDDGEAAEAEEE